MGIDHGNLLFSHSDAGLLDDEQYISTSSRRIIYSIYYLQSEWNAWRHDQLTSSLLG